MTQHTSMSAPYSSVVREQLLYNNETGKRGIVKFAQVTGENVIHITEWCNGNVFQSGKLEDRYSTKGLFDVYTTGVYYTVDGIFAMVPIGGILYLESGDTQFHHTNTFDDFKKLFKPC